MCVMFLFCVVDINSSKIYWSGEIKIHSRRRKVFLQPFSLFKIIQSEIATKSFGMVFAFYTCQKLNSIVGLFGTRFIFIQQSRDLQLNKMVRNWKNNKIDILRIAISHDPDCENLWFYRNPYTTKGQVQWNITKIIWFNSIS